MVGFAGPAHPVRHLSPSAAVAAKVRLLGHVEVVPDDDKAPPLPLSGPTQRRVLASLALRLNEVVSVSRLTEVVWPSCDLPPRADHNLRTYVHRLRSAMDGCGDRVETAGAGYRLRLHPSELDIRSSSSTMGATDRSRSWSPARPCR